MVRTSVNKEPADIKVIVFRQFTSFEGFIASRDTAIHINMVAMEIAISDIFHAPFIEKSLESALIFHVHCPTTLRNHVCQYFKSGLFNTIVNSCRSTGQHTIFLSMASPSLVPPVGSAQDFFTQ